MCGPAVGALPFDDLRLFVRAFRMMEDPSMRTAAMRVICEMFRLSFRKNQINLAYEQLPHI